MILKDGVSVNGLKPEMIIVVIIVQDSIDYVSKVKLNGKELHEAVITSCVDGSHSRASLHYVGYAFDLRVWHWEPYHTDMIVSEIKKRLNEEYDVVLEKKSDGSYSHIHIEYQPKKGVNH